MARNDGGGTGAVVIIGLILLAFMFTHIAKSSSHEVKKEKSRGFRFMNSRLAVLGTVFLISLILMMLCSANSAQTLQAVNDAAHWDGWPVLFVIGVFAFLVFFKF